MSSALIIDDEPPACDILRALLAEHPSVAIVGEVGTVAEARARLARHDYDLVFLDVQLRGGSGFDLLPHVRPGSRIIFVSAYDEHALRAFEVNALDDLVKPVAPVRLAHKLPRLGSSATTPPFPSGRALLIDDRVLIKPGAGSEPLVRLADIRFVASSENYSEIAVGDAGERLLVRRTMEAWEDILPPRHFVRVHRQMIVNATHVRRLDRASEATSLLHLDGVTDPALASYRCVGAWREALSVAGRSV
ncbi:MAG: response regulator transcription factor [Undibacterium sp.]|nr:response regulator transcription factor [Opitutaceae bacterium]